METEFSLIRIIWKVIWKIIWKKKLLVCQNILRFERRSLFNNQILTMYARRRTTVIIVGVTVAANISRVAGTLVGIHSIDTTTLKDVENNFSQYRVRGGTSRKITIIVFRVELPYSDLGNVG